MKAKKKALKFTHEDWVEIDCALGTKMWAIEDGVYDPECSRGENKRWVKDLQRIHRVIEKAGLS